MAARSADLFDLPPREPSPEPILTPLPPPALRTQRSRQRLRLPITALESPPIPPTLVGSPLLGMCAPRKRTISLNPDFCPDADEFGARRTPRSKAVLPPSPPHSERRRARVLHRRTSSISISPSSSTRANARARSPPPVPRRPSVAPPVPPIPDFVRVDLRKTVVLQPCDIPDESIPVICLSPAAHDAQVPVKVTQEGMTCLKFFSLHNHPQPMSVRAY